MLQEMKSSKSDLKYILENVTVNVISVLPIVMLTHYLPKMKNNFGKEMKTMNNSKVPFANCIDDITGSRTIANQWKTHFSCMCNSCKDKCSKEFVSNDVNKVSFNRFTTLEIGEPIKDKKVKVLVWTHDMANILKLRESDS